METATIRIYASTFEPPPADFDGDWCPDAEVDNDVITVEGDEDTPLASAIANALIARGITEPSAGTRRDSWAPGIWYSSVDDDINYATGQQTSYTAHLVDVAPATAAAAHSIIVAC